MKHDMFAVSSSFLRMLSWLGSGVHEERETCRSSRRPTRTLTAANTGDTVCSGVGLEVAQAYLACVSARPTLWAPCDTHCNLSRRV